MPQADGAGIVVRRRIEVRRAAAKGFRPRQHLRMDFQADDRFVFFEKFWVHKFAT